MSQPQAAATALAPEPLAGDSVARYAPILPGYRIGELLHKSARAEVYRAVRERDNVPVIIKFLSEHAFTPENVAYYRHEYEILRGLNVPGVIRVHAFEQRTDNVALVLEDFGGVSLKTLVQEYGPRLSVAKKLQLAVGLATALGDVQATSIVHKDINPNNVVVNIDTGEVKLIDFGLATPLPVERASTAIPTLLQGTLQYIAPEQTGRMNRAVDYRSDFYSLGATLYEVFTGQPPFAGREPLELIHAHIARQPLALNQLDATIPETLSAIVLKLLAKTAEERYQSIWSLEADLKECLQRWSAQARIDPFPIDRLRIQDRFRLPQKLYGRENDIETLLAAFDRASGGGSEVLFVTGHSGIGKTSLVREVYKPITAKRGYFAAGKFDQFQRNTPYSAILTALRELIRQMLSESEEQVGHWREHLQNALGQNARVLTDLLPEAEMIVGKQAPVPTLGPVETQERLAAVMRKFFAAVCRPEHPLSLYLDDLQWADSASINMLLQVLGDASLKYFLLIAAYRDNEVDPSHPLLVARRKLESDGVAIGDIRLVPHAAGHIEQLLTDALGIGTESAGSLAALVHEKTGGNPFFVEEFLKSLHAKQLLRFDPGPRCWRWNLEEIRAETVTDNVVDLLAQNIRTLPNATQRLLRFAACIGGQFDTRTLAFAADESMRYAVNGLREALVLGFVQPLDEACRWTGADDTNEPSNASFRFAHDRIQQAVYELIPEDQRQRVHYRIGRLLLENTTEAEIEGNRFQIVNHLNAGRSQAPAGERVDLATLNLAAGRQAKASAVYQAGLNYFKTGIELLGEAAWRNHYDLALALNIEAGQMAPLVGDFAELDLRLDLIRAQARTALDKMPIYEAKIEAENRRADFHAASAIGCEALQMLGAGFPAKVNALHLLFYGMRARLALFGKTPESLVNHRRMTDPTRIAEARLLRQLGHVFYYSNREYLAIAMFRQLYLCAKYGHCETAPFVYASYAYQLSVQKRIDEAYRFGQLALALLDKLQATAQRPFVSLMARATIVHWKVHCRTALPTLLDIYQEALDMGDIETAAMSLTAHGYISFHAGEPLPSVRDAVLGYIQTQKKLTNGRKEVGIAQVYLDACAYLMDLDEPNECFSAPGEPDKKTEKKHPYTYHLHRAFMAVHFGDAKTAYTEAQRARKYLYMVMGVLRYGELYDGLAHAMIHSALPKTERGQNRAALKRTTQRLKLLAQHGPDNYRHRWLLLEAEGARLDGKYPAAARYYDEAIAAAKASGHLHEEALANEIAARHYLNQKRLRVAQAYMQEARALYVRWGAKRKVRWLDETYPQLQLGSVDAATSLDDSATDMAAAIHLDLPDLMKALKNIAEENVHSQILKKTIDIAMQFAGAEKALLLLRNADDELRVEADMDISRTDAELLRSVPIESSERLSLSVVNYARRTNASVVIHDAQEPQSIIPGLQNEPYVRDHGVKSILCLPVTVGSDSDPELIGLLYVENNQSTHAFTERRIEALEIVCLSVAGRLELSRKAITDSLTGLYNRAYFESSLSKELAVARRKQRPLSLVMIDIDHFKRINDGYGHQAGDAVLQHVARIVKDSARDSDVAARYGGEEMALILNETSAEQAAEIAGLIRQSIEEQPLKIDDILIRSTASFGIASNGFGREESAPLIKAADDALYQSKENGRNRVTVAP